MVQSELSSLPIYMSLRECESFWKETCLKPRWEFLTTVMIPFFFFLQMLVVLFCLFVLLCLGSFLKLLMRKDHFGISITVGLPPKLLANSDHFSIRGVEMVCVYQVETSPYTFSQQLMLANTCEVPARCRALRWAQWKVIEMWSQSLGA